MHTTLLLILGLACITNATILVESQKDLNNLCCDENITDNLFIKGENSVYSLQPLENIKRIDGYLIIWNSNLLKSIYNLRHLNHVGEVVISNNPQMCFADTLNWTLITSSNVYISDNSNNCSSCHSECLGCWQIGPRSCQLCKNFMSGTTCVKVCPEGTFVDPINKICTESIPTDFPQLSSSFCNDTCLNVFWNDTSFIPYGVILGHKLYMNNYEVYTSIVDDSDLPLYTNVTISSLNYSTSYSFQIQILNSVGWSSLSDPLTVTTPEAPPLAPTNIQIFNIQIFNLTASTAKICWNKSSSSGPIQFYLIELYELSGDTRREFLNISSDGNNNYVSVMITGLEHNTTYQFRIVGVRESIYSPYTNYTLFTTPSGIPMYPVNIKISEITGNTVSLEWHVNENSEKIDYFSYFLHDGDNNMIHNGNVNGTNVAIVNLTQFTYYIFNIRSKNEYGWSSYQTINFRTEIIKPVIITTPKISNISKTDMTITIFDDSAFILKRRLHIHIKDIVVVITEVNNLSLKLSNYLNVSHDISYAFQLFVTLVDNTTVNSNTSDFYTLLPETNSNNPKTYFGLSLFWLIVSCCAVGVTLIVMLTVLIIINKRKNNKVRHTTKSIQKPRPSSIITSDAYTNPVYLDVIGHPSYSEQRYTNNANVVEMYDEIDLHSNLPGSTGHYSRTRPLAHDTPIHVYDSLSRSRPTLKKNPIYGSDQSETDEKSATDL